MSSDKKCIFITSADEYSANFAAEMALSDEWRQHFKTVRIGYHDKEAVQKLIDMGAEAVKQDLNDEDALVKNFSNVDAVYVVPPILHHRPEETIKLLKACKHAKVKAVVLSSAFAVRALKKKEDLERESGCCGASVMVTQVQSGTQTATPAGQETCGGIESPVCPSVLRELKILEEFHKLEKELCQMAKHDLRCAAVLRHGLYSQFLVAFAHPMQQDGQLPMPTGRGKWAPLDVRDGARAAIALLAGKASHENQMLLTEPVGNEGRFHVFELTGPRALAGDEIAEQASKVLDMKVRFKDADHDETEKRLKSHLRERFNIGMRCIQVIMETFELIKKEQLSHVSKDVKQLTGHEPKDLDRYFRDNRDAFRPPNGN